MKQPKVEINGQKHGHRHLVVIAGNAVYLSGVLFKMFTILALERFRNGGADGWVQTRELDQNRGQAARYMWSLRKAIRDGLAGTAHQEWFVAETGGGKYRLLTDPGKIKFSDLAALIDFDNHAITKRLRGPGGVKFPKGTK